VHISLYNLLDDIKWRAKGKSGHTAALEGTDGMMDTSRALILSRQKIPAREMKNQTRQRGKLVGK